MVRELCPYLKRQPDVEPSALREFETMVWSYFERPGPCSARHALSAPSSGTFAHPKPSYRTSDPIEDYDSVRGFCESGTRRLAYPEIGSRVVRSKSGTNFQPHVIVSGFLVCFLSLLKCVSTLMHSGSATSLLQQDVQKVRQL